MESDPAANVFALPARRCEQRLHGYVRQHLQLIEQALSFGVPYTTITEGRAHGWLCRHFRAHDGTGGVSGPPLQAALRRYVGPARRFRGAVRTASAMVAGAAILDEGRHGRDPQKVPAT